VQGDSRSSAKEVDTGGVVEAKAARSVLVGTCNFSEEGHVPQRRLSMRRITEVLRLAAQGLSYRQIGQSVDIRASTVQSYLKRATGADLSWPLPEGLDAVAVEARLFKRSEEANRAGRPEPNWLDVHRERKQGKHVTLQLLWLEYKQAHPDGWGYTQFCAHYHRWLARQDVVMRLEYPAGERMFVDFCGDTLSITDPDTGEVWDAQVFVSALAASGYLYVEATGSQDLAAWQGAHVSALELVARSDSLAFWIWSGWPWGRPWSAAAASRHPVQAPRHSASLLIARISSPDLPA
jgi:hypothetical protein